MRVALLSDIHANLVALDAVLAALPSVEEIWVMGDTVGYGPEPAETLARLRGIGAHLVAGNHDCAVATGDGIELFNPVAAEAARMHRSWLGDDDRTLLASLPLMLTRPEATLVHGSLRQPLWEYIRDAGAAAATLGAATTDIVCCGHTHIPSVFAAHGGEVGAELGVEGRSYPLDERILINPGSVGQPRDGDPRASWALLDTSVGVTFQRTPYDIATTQRRMRDRGLPAFLVERIASGI